MFSCQTEETEQPKLCLRKESCLQSFTGARSAPDGISASILLLHLELPQVLSSRHHVCIYHEAPALSVPKLVNTEAVNFPLWSGANAAHVGRVVLSDLFEVLPQQPMFWAFPGYKMSPNSGTQQCYFPLKSGLEDVHYGCGLNSQ